MQKDPLLEQVFHNAGGPSALARQLGLSPQATSNWRRVPAQWVARVSLLAGIAAHELRPDLYDMSTVDRDAGRMPMRRAS